MIDTTLEPGVVYGSHPADLDAIARPDAALAIWPRQTDGALRAALETLDYATIDDLALDVANGQAMDDALRTAGYPAAVASLLGQDMAALAGRHAALTGADRLRVRLEVVETDACRRFHADYGTLRLLCTYVGPGTQWCHAERQDAIHMMPTGAIGIFKGRSLLDPPTILHRSPPILATGGRRLILVIDPVHRSGAT